MEERDWKQYAYDLEKKVDLLEHQLKQALEQPSFDRDSHLNIEEALHLSEEKFTVAFANNPAAVALTRLQDGKFLDVNKTWEALLGFSRAEIVGQLASNLNIWPDQESRKRYVQTLREKGSIRDWKQSFYKCSGQTFIAEVSAQLLTIQGEQLILSTLIDITHHEQVEQALRESEERERLRAAQLDAVLKALPVGVAITDAKGGEILQNEAFFEVWGGTPPSTGSIADYGSYHSWWADDGQELEPEDWASAQAVLQGKTIIGQLLKIRRFDGKLAYVLNSASPIRDDQGRITGSAVAIQDITALRDAEQALKQANLTLENRVRERTAELMTALENLEVAEEELRIQNEELEASLAKEKALRSQLIQSEKYAALARLIASVAHEIQNPLQTVKNSLYLLKSEVQTTVAEDILEMASSESNRMSALVQQLSETYRPTDFHVIDFDLYDLLGKVQRLLDPRFRQSHIEWQLLSQPEPIRLRGVPDRIQQVFMNICLNATAAMEKNGGKIMVCVTHTNQRVCISFQDSGPGISSAVIERIFEPFFTTKEKGTGLGLAICYEIINEHAGEITVESLPGRGATFKVCLPLIPAAAKGQP